MRWGAIAFAGLLVVAAVAWIFTGTGMLVRPTKGIAFTSTGSGADTDAVPITVRVARSRAREHQSLITTQATTRAARTVTVRSEIEGRIVALGIDKGETVDKDTVVARVSVGDREARLREVEALVEQRRLEHQATLKLHAKGYNAQTKLAEATAKLEAARADRSRARKALADTVIRAPFAGIVSERPVEIGDFVKPGEAIAKIAELGTIHVRGTIPERERSNVKTGLPANVRFLDGTTRTGNIRFIASVADPSTRTYGIEVELDNADFELFDGQTVELSIPVAKVRAHQVPASILILHADGRLGVLRVNQEDRVVFQAAQVLAQNRHGVWLAGLPDEARLIVVGQAFVADGDKVTTEDAGLLVGAGQP